MIRDQGTLNVVLDTARRFIRERCEAAEQIAAEVDETQPMLSCGAWASFDFAIPQEFGGRYRAQHDQRSKG